LGILNIEPVSRKGMRLLISLYGMSETGKTLSALRLACGIEPDPKKRLLLDSEGGQRGRAYVDHVPGGYMYASLTPPFSPERYIEAINEIEQAGTNVLVIDSISHVWAAEGGILDMVEVATEKNDMAKWAKPKRRLGKLTRRLLSSDMHIILCSRAKQPMVETTDEHGKKKYVPGPIVPVQEKNLKYDITIMAHMLGDGRFSIAKEDGGKCPGALREVFKSADVMDEEMGRKLIEWIGGADVRSPELRRLEIEGTAAAEDGTKAFLAWWNSAPVKPHRQALRHLLGNFESVAKAADAERAREEEERRDRDGLDNPFGLPPIVDDARSTDAEPIGWHLVDADGEVRSQHGDAPAWLDAYAALVNACVTGAELDTLVDNNRATLARLSEDGRDWATIAVHDRRAELATPVRETAGAR
jgi:hypothetical protein